LSPVANKTYTQYRVVSKQYQLTENKLEDAQSNEYSQAEYGQCGIHTEQRSATTKEGWLQFNGAFHIN